MELSELQSDELSAWIALGLAPGVGRATVIRLVEIFGSAAAVWNAGSSAIHAVRGISSRARASLLRGPDIKSSMRVATAVSGLGGWIMRFTDLDYPVALAGISDRPAMLYGMGSREAVSAECVAVVGSRAASSYGIRVAGQLAVGLTGHGMCVVSGLALGIDTAAHRAALDAGGSTVAVIGCGLDVAYPRQNVGLARRIREKGAVITEYPPGTQPEARNFPVRNRIISGLSSAVVVIEAGRKSGSLITASTALEQGREVLAVPGSIYSLKSTGTHWLIRQGAVPVTCVDDILEALRWNHVAGDAGAEIHDAEENNGMSVQEPDGLSVGEKRLWAGLEEYPVHIDELAAACGMPAAEISGLLLRMELKGLVRAVPGQMYQRSAPDL